MNINRRVTATVKWGPNYIKHCEMNNGEKRQLEHTFSHRKTSSISLRTTGCLRADVSYFLCCRQHHRSFKNRTKQVRFYLSVNFHLQLQIRAWVPYGHIVNDLNFNIKRRENLKATYQSKSESGTAKKFTWETLIFGQRPNRACLFW